MSKIKNGELDQYHGAELFEQQQFGTAGVEGVNIPYPWVGRMRFCLQ